MDGSVTSDFLHIHCGDCSAEVLRSTDVPGDILVWREIYTEGPVPGGVPEEVWREVRARFLTGFGLEYESVLRGINERYQRLEEASRYREVVLWFDACMFDQTIMVHVIDRLSRLDLDATRTSLICVSDRGLGEYPADEMAALLDTRREITPHQVDVALGAWAAFSSADPREIETLLEKDTSALPHVAPALRRHLQQYPSVRNGLNRLQNACLDVVASGVNRLGPIFARVSEREDQPFFGDTTLFACLDEMATPPHPLLTIEGPGTIVAPVDKPLQDIGRWCLAITDTGRDVLAGKLDWIELNGIDRWLGGVHLQTNQPAWRWDEQTCRLVAG